MPAQHLVEQRPARDDRGFAAGLRRLQAQQSNDVGGVAVIGEPRCGLIAAMFRPRVVGADVLHMAEDVAHRVLRHRLAQHRAETEIGDRTLPHAPALDAECRARNGSRGRAARLRGSRPPAAAGPARSRSLGPIAAMSMPVASSRFTAASSSAISALVSGRIQSVRCAISRAVPDLRPFERLQWDHFSHCGFVHRYPPGALGARL